MLCSEQSHHKPHEHSAIIHCCTAHVLRHIHALRSVSLKLCERARARELHSKWRRRVRSANYSYAITFSHTHKTLDPPKTRHISCKQQHMSTLVRCRRSVVFSASHRDTFTRIGCSQFVANALATTFLFTVAAAEEWCISVCVGPHRAGFSHVLLLLRRLLGRTQFGELRAHTRWFKCRREYVTD